MGTIRNPAPVKLFIGLLISDTGLVPDVERRLVDGYGPVDHRSLVSPFTFTSYYEHEMGKTVHRFFLSFERLIEPDQLCEIKRQTNGIEQELAPLLKTVKRPVNLDPGYLEQSKIVLASTKNFYHRIYLGRGIFGEVTMYFKDKAWQFFPWTYPDYQSEEHQRFFLKLRQIYRTQLRTMCVTRRES